jgi:hypothetical protein
VFVWNVDKLDEVVQHNSIVDANSAALSNDRKTFIVGGNDFSVRVYDCVNGKELGNC